MANYRSFSCLAKGYSHRDGCCQDFSGFYDDDGSLQIAVISDGHGDKSCFRSDVGSRIAVEVAIANLKKFAAGILEQGWQDRLTEEDDPETQALMYQLKASIVADWYNKVDQHLRECPLTEEDLSRPHRHNDTYRRGKNLHHIYGCTLIAAMRVEERLVVLHVGDGRCVVLHANGEVNQPVPWDNQCIGNVTTSMCHEDAHLRCRHYVQDLTKHPILACFVTSDGIEDSFEVLENLNGLDAYFCNVTSRLAREGIAAVEEQMKEELPYISQYGSQDDMSFGAIVDPEGIKDLAESLSLRYEMYKFQREADAARRKLSSMQRKMEFLRDNVSKAEQQLAEARRERDLAEKALAYAERDLEGFNRRAGSILGPLWKKDPEEQTQTHAEQTPEREIREGGWYVDAEWEPAKEEIHVPGGFEEQLQEYAKKFVVRVIALRKNAKQNRDDCQERKERSIRSLEEAEARLERARKELADYSETRQSYVDQHQSAMDHVTTLKRKMDGIPVEQEEQEPVEVTEEAPAPEETKEPEPIAEEIPASDGEEAPALPGEEEPAAQEEAPPAEEEAPPAEEEAPPAEEEAPPAEEWGVDPEESDWESPRATACETPELPDASEEDPGEDPGF